MLFMNIIRSREIQHVYRVPLTLLPPFLAVVVAPILIVSWFIGFSGLTKRAPADVSDLLTIQFLSQSAAQ